MEENHHSEEGSNRKDVRNEHSAFDEIYLGRGWGEEIPGIFICGLDTNGA
jgi:hypothetical protein